MIKRRRSKLHGWGVFADQRINKNKRIIDYAGQKITHQQSLKREHRYMKKGTIWCFQLNRRWVRDAAVGGNIARFINHSCHPNCYVHIVGDTIWIRAEHPQGRRADLRLHDRWRRPHPVPMPPGLPTIPVTHDDANAFTTENTESTECFGFTKPNSVISVPSVLRISSRA
jgi:hypothetical protein